MHPDEDHNIEDEQPESPEQKAVRSNVRRFQFSVSHLMALTLAAAAFTAVGVGVYKNVIEPFPVPPLRRDPKIERILIDPDYRVTGSAMNGGITTRINSVEILQFTDTTAAELAAVGPLMSVWVSDPLSENELDALQRIRVEQLSLRYTLDDPEETLSTLRESMPGTQVFYEPPEE